MKGIAHAAALGIRAMELEWVQMVPKNPERMQEIREASQKFSVTLTVHAPYYVNLNSPEKDKLVASKKRIIDALKMAQLAGARSVCVHAAFNLGKPPEEVMERICLATKDILKLAYPLTVPCVETANL